MSSMTEILPIMIFAIVFAIISHKNSGYNPIVCRYEKKERLFYFVLTISVAVFAGLRSRYNDTETYRDMYSLTVKNFPTYENLTDGIDWLAIGDSPGFFFVLRIMAWLDFSDQSMIMCFSLFYVPVNLWFFRKYSCNLWLSVLIYLTFAGFVFSLAAIKQCTAMALCLIATDRAIKKKYGQFLLFVIIASLFHAYSFMYLAVPFLFFRPWSVYTVFMLVIFALIGTGMQSLLGTLLNITDMLGENYDASSFIGEGVNPIRLMVTAVPVLLSLVTSKQIAKMEEKEQYLIVNLAMLNAEIMFVALFGTANYFARLANYFIPFQAVAIPWLLKPYEYKDRKTMTALAVTGYSLFCIYSLSINANFNAMFKRRTLWWYLQSLIEGGL